MINKNINIFIGDFEKGHNLDSSDILCTYSVNAFDREKVCAFLNEGDDDANYLISEIEKLELHFFADGNFALDINPLLSLIWLSPYTAKKLIQYFLHKCKGAN